MGFDLNAFSAQRDKERKKKSQTSASLVDIGSIESELSSIREERLKEEQKALDAKLSPRERKLKTQEKRLNENYGSTSGYFKAASAEQAALQNAGGKLTSLDQIAKDSTGYSFADYEELLNYNTWLSDTDRRAIYNLNKDRSAAIQKEVDALTEKAKSAWAKLSYNEKSALIDKNRAAEGKDAVSFTESLALSDKDRQTLAYLLDTKTTLDRANATYDKHGNAAGLTNEEIDKLKDEAYAKGDTEGYFYYENLKGKKEVWDNLNKLYTTKASGSKLSLADEAVEISQMEDGDERTKRLEALEKEFKKLGIDFKTYFSMLVGEEAGLEFFKESEGNALEATGATAADVAMSVGRGAGSFGEGVLDFVGHGIANAADLFGADEFAGKTRIVASTDYVRNWLTSDTIERYSVLGRTSRNILEGVGQVAAMVGVSALGGAAFGTASPAASAFTTATMGASSVGLGTGEAFQSGATKEEAITYGLASGVTETLSEMLFQGLGKGFNVKGISSLDDIVASKVSSVFKKPALKNVVQYAVKSGAEGVEEILAGFGGAVAKKMTYMSEEDVGKILDDEGLLESFIVGTLTSSIAQAPDAIKSTAKGRDFVSGLTTTEQKAIDEILKKRVAEAEKDGEKIDSKEKAKLYDDLVKAMDRGELSINEIEEVLGEEAKKKLDELSEKEAKDKAEFAEHYEGEELKKRIEEYDAASERAKLEAELSNEVFEKVKDTRLAETYREQYRVGQTFTVNEEDLKKMDSKRADAYRRAMEDGIVSNTRKAHDLVDITSKIEAEKGVRIDLYDTKKLAEMGFNPKDVFVNGVTHKGGVAINVQSKKALNSIVGHELLHVLRGDQKQYETLRDVAIELAKTRGEYDSRWKQIDALYRGKKGYNGKLTEELVADIVGDYLFSDPEFIRNLSVKDRNLFQRIWDEVKYLFNLATAGSAEARQLEKLKKTFEDVYRGDGSAKGQLDTNTNKKIEVVGDVAVASNVAKVLKSPEYKKPKDYMALYSVSSTPEWEKNYLNRHHSKKDLEVVKAVRLFTEKMVQDDAVRGYVPMGEYRYTKMGPLRSNVEYVVSFDMDTSCPRTFQFLNFRDEIQRRGGRYLTYNESINLLELMRAYGQQIPCCYCYVENKRVLLSASYNNFFGFRNAVLNAETDAEAEKLMYGYDAKKGLPEASRKAFERWRSDRAYNPSLTDVWTATNTARNSVLNFLDAQKKAGIINGKTAASKLNKMVTEEFGITDKGAIAEIETFINDWSYDTLANIPHVYNTDNNIDVSSVDERALALNHEALAYSKAASSAKSVENYVPYTDQLKNISKEDRDYIMGMGGIRKHSSNDFRMDYVQDYFLFYADLAAEEWTGHTYTKSADFTRIFACTNDRINMSIAFYEDSDGNLRENLDEGASWKDVKELRKAHKNVGAMAMVTSDNQLSFALNADWIDMIIPFHASGLDKAVWYNLRMWNDYTSKQGERFFNAETMRQRLIEAGVEIPKNAKSSDIRALFDETFQIKHIYGKKGEVLKPHFFPGDTYVNGQLVPGHHNDTDTYFKLCEEYGVHPRFYGIMVSDASGNQIEVTKHPSYLKLIKETARTDSEQETIQFNFGNYDPLLKMTPFEYAMKRLQEEAKNGGFENTKEDPYGVVDEFMNEYFDKDRPLGYLTERAKETRDILVEMSKSASQAYPETFTPKRVAPRVNLPGTISAPMFSLSENGATPKKYGDLNITGEDVRYQPAEAAPEEISPASVEPAPVAEPVAEPLTEKKAVKDISFVKEPITAATETNVEEDGKNADVLTEEPEVVRKERSKWQGFLRRFVDKFAIFEKISLDNNNRELQARADSLHRADSAAQYFMRHGNKKAGVKSVYDMRKEVKNSGKEQEFSDYMYHVHNIDRMSLESRAAEKIEGIRKDLGNLTDEQIVTLSESKITKKTSKEDASKIRKAREFVNISETKNKPVFGEYTAEDSRKFVKEFEEKNPEFKAWAKDVYDYVNYLRDYMVQEGIISQETADLWSEIYPHYVPIRRDGKTGAAVSVPLDTRKTGVNAPIKKATGGNADILPLFDTLGARTVQTFNAIAKNRLGVELKNTLNKGAIDETTDAAALENPADAVDNHEGWVKEGVDGSLPTFTVFEDGKRVTFEIPEDVYDALKPNDSFYQAPVKPGKDAKFKDKAIYALKKTPEAIGKFRRAVLTEYNPFFMLTNAGKDFQDVLVNSQHPAQTYKKMPRALIDLVTNGKWAQEFYENGGSDLTFFERDSNTFEEEKTRAQKIVGFPFKIIPYANNVIEKVPRLAEYIASRDAGKSIDVAMLDAARVTTNFAAGGYVTKFANKNGATFLNASVQGFAQQARNIREAKHNGFKGWLGLAAKCAIAGIPAVALNYLIWGLWRDDDDFEELSDYVKQNYYVLWKNEDGTFVRFPKGRTLAVIQNGLEQMVDLATGDDEADFAEFARLFIDNLAPSNPIDNNILSPIIQAATNTTWYGEDLVPTKLQSVPTEEQFDESTDAISKWIGEKTGISPYKLNYLFDQYSGVIGDVFLPTLTLEAERGDGNLITAPFLDKFTTDPVMKNQNVTDFYELKEELQVAANGSKATDEDTLKALYMNSVNKEIADLNAKKREIQNSATFSDNEKYAKVRDFQQQIVDLAKDAINSYEKVNVSGKYATVNGVQYRYYEPGEDSTAEPGWRKLSETQIEKQNEVTDALNISVSEYWSKNEEYDYAYESPENYAVSKTIGYENYRAYTKDLNKIKSDTDSYGNTISESRKKKVISYINELDIPAIEKVILYKNQYPSDNSYNNAIVTYLNNRNDISYADKQTILVALGIVKKSNNAISW